MAKLIYVTGGARSGKSTHAQQLAESFPPPHIFVATCPIIDDEMNARIQRHRDHRDPQIWGLIEEERDLPAALDQIPNEATVLIDCITLWINNLLYDAEQSKQTLTEEMVRAKAEAFVKSAKSREGITIIVSNELGMGIVPIDSTSRTYRDLVGIANQTIAKSADTPIFMVSGIPMELTKR